VSDGSVSTRQLPDFVWVTGVPDRVIGKCFGTPLGRKRDRDLYGKILGISAPWRVAE